MLCVNENSWCPLDTKFFPPTKYHPHHCFHRGTCGLLTMNSWGQHGAPLCVGEAKHSPRRSVPFYLLVLKPSPIWATLDTPGRRAGNHSKGRAGGFCRFTLLKPCLG